MIMVNPLQTNSFTVARGRLIVRPTLLASAFVFCLCAGIPALAGDYASREVGGWTVAASKDGQGCFLTREYDRPGATALLLGLDMDGTNHLTVLNTNWSIKPKDRLELTFRLSKGGYDKHFAVGLASEGKQGFVTSFEARFPSYFAASRTLHVFRGNIPVERLDLEGSGAAVVELRQCLGVLRAKPAAAGKEEQRDRIPADPFAARPKHKPGK
jgi:hypothetical protein